MHGGSGVKAAAVPSHQESGAGGALVNGADQWLFLGHRWHEN